MSHPTTTRLTGRLRLLAAALLCLGLGACAAGGTGGGGFQPDGVDFGGNGQSHGHP